MITITVTPSYTEDAVTFELPDGPVSATVLTVLAEETLKSSGTRKIKSVSVKSTGNISIDGNIALKN